MATFPHIRLIALTLLCLTLRAWSAPAPAAPNPADPAREIDRLLAADWQAHQRQPNPPAPDEVFLRRVYLDIIGRIPSPTEAREFLSDREPGKRAELIDKLL